MIKISELYIYPVKSLAGIKLSTSVLSTFGLKYDRRWMIVDANGQFLSQRELAKMATIKTAIENEELVLTHNQNKINVPAIHQQSETIPVTVWKDTLQATKVSGTVDQWLSQILGQDCQLVYMQQQAERQIDKDFTTEKQYVSFADAFPILVISQASLDELNNKLDKPVNINRFRANIIVSGSKPHAEDYWQDLFINDTEFKAVKKCSRCIMPSINQSTGIQDNVKMLAVLNRYRKEDKKIKFGQNLIYRNVSTIQGKIISCGDEIKLKK
jgi:uncharacterized protein YcbX